MVDMQKKKKTNPPYIHPCVISKHRFENNSYQSIYFRLILYTLTNITVNFFVGGMLSS